MGLMQVRPSQPPDRPFLIEVAPLACALDGHPLPAGDDPEVLAILPGQTDGVVIATDDAGPPIGGAWWHLHSPPLVRDAGGQAAPEVVMAVLEVARDRGLAPPLSTRWCRRRSDGLFQHWRSMSTSPTRPPDSTCGQASELPVPDEAGSAWRWSGHSATTVRVSPQRSSA